MKKVKVRKKSLKGYLNSNLEKWTLVQKTVKAGVLVLTFVFSLNSYGVVNTLDCSSELNTLEDYNKGLRAKRTPTNSYNLGFTAICLGMYNDGLKHIHTASKGGHIAATKVLASYYDKNQSFDNDQNANLENTYRSIDYYEKVVELIKNISSYPEGATKDMRYIEYTSMTSYRVFTRLPALYFNIYFTLIGDTINNNTLHSGTLDLLQKMGDAATHCLRRPALSVWKEKKERVYKTQQIECQAYLDFVEATYPLENERIQIANSCTISMNQCKEHIEIINRMDGPLNTLFTELEKSPGLNIAQRSQ